MLHAHFGEGGFLAGGRKLTPRQFKEEVLDHLDMEPGQSLILVACQTAGLPETAGPGHAASALAVLSKRPVIAATGDASTTPAAQVITAHIGIRTPSG